MKQAATAAMLALALLYTVSAVAAQGGGVNPRKGQPVLIKAGQVAKLTWKPAPPHPDVVMCCGGALQLSWSPMDSGVVSSVVLNVDDSCPSDLQNQQYVEYIYQAQPKGLVTLDFKQNGDYYISCAVAEHCSQQGMQFLLAVRGCPQDNPTYTPVLPINVQCQPQQMGMNRTMGAMGGAGMGTGTGLAGAAGTALPGSLAARQQQQQAAKSSAGSTAAGVLAAVLGSAVAAMVL